MSDESEGGVPSKGKPSMTGGPGADLKITNEKQKSDSLCSLIRDNFTSKNVKTKIDRTQIKSRK